MAKTYIEDIRLTAVRNRLFSRLADNEQVNIFDVITLSSGDYLPTQKMVEGKYHVYGGGGITDKTHHDFNVESETLGIGRVGARCGCVFRVKSKSWVTDNALYASRISEDYEIDFLVHYLEFKNINQLANTAAQPVISQKRISGISIPKIDIKSQKEILGILNDVEKGIIHIENDKFGVSKTLNFISAAEDLDAELTHQLTLVQKLRQQLLHEAVQGKLVPQDPGDEPASILLQKIKAEKERLVKEKKIKKDKDLPEIKAEEKPFEIPEGWVWCNFGEMCQLINGDRSKNYPNRHEYVDEGMPWINTGHIEPDGSLSTKEMYYITKRKYDSLRSGKIQDGDLVYCLRGATFGKTAFVKPYTQGAIASSLMIIRLFNNINKQFVFHYLRSDLAKSQLLRFNNGSAQPNLAANDVNRYLIPLPPLLEQYRIVQKLEQLLQVCDALQAGIQESRGYNEQLLQQVLREALQG